MELKTYSDLSADIKKNVHKFQCGNFDLVVGIPRSGMIPAYMIALLLNKSCTDLRSLIEDLPLQKGSRPLGCAIQKPSDAKRVLLVDDSIWSGNAMKSALQQIPDDVKEKITTLAVYSTERVRDDIDITLCYVQPPRVFEWNIFHHGVIAHACVDIDGVLCQDPTREQNDDGECYKNFLLNATPLILPSGTINTLVTNRLEKYRPETEEWLRRHHVKYDKLLMLDLPSAKERQRLRLHAAYKGEYYKTSSHRLFIESESGQAKEIAKISQKPVFCIESNQMYGPSRAMRILNNPRSIEAYLRSYVPYIPAPLKESLKAVHGMAVKAYRLGRVRPIKH
jgi:uncharacterized HAD superfamily protein/pyrimidine operon attenuation protein/uracil phosphoribosyltransferase